jgi:hypothetical protein
MASKRRRQTFNKHNRERAVEEKRTLKRQRKQERRDAARNGEPMPDETPASPDEAPTTPAEPATDVG